MSNSEGVFPQVHAFDPLSNQWTALTHMPVPVHGAFPVADVLRNKVRALDTVPCYMQLHGFINSLLSHDAVYRRGCFPCL